MKSLHVSGFQIVIYVVTRIALVVSLATLPVLGADVPLNRVLEGVQGRYNRAKTLQVSFNETYTANGHPRRSESGELTLRKPGRMLWTYSNPGGKLFLSDGKTVYLYTPDTHQVERMPLKASEDVRAPLAFLLGKLDFEKEFRNIQLRPDGVNMIVTADAKSDKLPYQAIEMLITPDSQIRKLVVRGQDESVLAFTFEGEKLNPPVDDAQFRFRMPAGATFAEEAK